MPLQPRPENVRHPLKLLRSILSEDPATPVPQSRLAELIEMSPASIKQTEVGDRQISGPMKSLIQMGLGAVWSEERKRWEMAWTSGDEAPVYTYELYSVYRAYITRLPDQRIKRDLEGDIKRKVSLLLARVPDDRWWFLIVRLLADLSDAMIETFPERGGEIDQEFGTTELRMRVWFNRETGHVADLRAAPRAQWSERDKSGQLTSPQSFEWSGDQDNEITDQPALSKRRRKK
jgi:hypothetical protein